VRRAGAGQASGQCAFDIATMPVLPDQKMGHAEPVPESVLLKCAIEVLVGVEAIHKVRDARGGMGEFLLLWLSGISFTHAPPDGRPRCPVHLQLGIRHGALSLTTAVVISRVPLSVVVSDFTSASVHHEGEHDGRADDVVACGTLLRDLVRAGGGGGGGGSSSPVLTALLEASDKCSAGEFPSVANLGFHLHP